MAATDERPQEDRAARLLDAARPARPSVDMRGRRRSADIDARRRIVGCPHPRVFGRPRRRERHATECGRLHALPLGSRPRRSRGGWTRDRPCTDSRTAARVGGERLERRSARSARRCRPFLPAACRCCQGGAALAADGRGCSGRHRLPRQDRASARRCDRRRASRGWRPQRRREACSSWATVFLLRPTAC